MESKRIYDMSYHWIKMYIKDNKTNRIGIQYSNFDINTAYVIRKTIDMVLTKYSSEIETKLGFKKKHRYINANVSVNVITGEERTELETRLTQITKLLKANQTDRILIEYDKLDDRIMADDLRKAIDLTLIVRKRETWYAISNSTQFVR